MLWHIKIPGDNVKRSFASVLVEAEDWYTALKNGLDGQGLVAGPMSKLDCSIRSGGGFAVLDRDTGVIYELMPASPKSHHEAPTIPPPRGLEPAEEAEALTATPRAEMVFFENASLWKMERGKKELCKIELEKVPRDTVLGTCRPKPGTIKP